MAEGGRLTWFPFNVGDWLADDRVAVMGWKLRGAYIDLLARMWNRAQGGGDCSVPDDDAYLSGVLGATPDEVSEIRARLIEGPMAVFQNVDGKLVNKRLLREFEQASALVKSASDAGKTGAERRWGDRKAVPKASPKRECRSDDGYPMGSALGHDSIGMRSPKRFDGSLHIQEEVPVQEDYVPVETTYLSDSTVGAQVRAGDSDRGRLGRPPESKKRATRVPDPLDLEASCEADGTTFRAVAERLGIHPLRVDVLRDEFVDYWRGIAGQKGRKLDWPGTWRNRCRDAPAKYRASSAPTSNQQRYGSEQPRHAASVSMANLADVMEETRGRSTGS